MSIPVACDSLDPAQPLVFRSPGDRPPTLWTDGRAGARQQAAGITRIARIELWSPPGPVLRGLAAAGLITHHAAAADRQRVVLHLGGTGPRRLELPDCTVTPRS